MLAGALACRGQTNVGSTSIVGYATVSIASGFNLMANPLSAGVTNGANEIGLFIDGERILTWNGHGFDEFDYTSLGGWMDAQSQRIAPPALPPGRGFFLFNPGPATNWVFEGLIVPSPGSTNSIMLTSGYSLVGSPLPASVTAVTSPPVDLPLIDGMLILTWNATNYVYSSFDSGFGGWVDANLKPKAAPSCTVGQGFFIFNPGPPVVWEQSLP